jgi:predicted DNA-binding transcriptional regulator AlpA
MRNFSRKLRPNVQYLGDCGHLLLNSKEMALFLQIPYEAVADLANTERIPAPSQLGLGRVLRWNVFELLDWIDAGCPARREWIAYRKATNSYHRFNGLSHWTK